MPTKVESLLWLHQAWSQCRGCNLCQERQNVVFGDGNPDSQIMIIGEAPGETEDKYGLPFIGAAGQLLDQYLAQSSDKEHVQEIFEKLISARSSRDKDGHRVELRNELLNEVYFTNAVMCRPPENRDPIPKELEACRTRLLEQIYLVDPVLILTAGRIATEALVGRKVSITQSRGELFDIEIPGKLHSDQKLRYPVLAILHPSYLLRKNDFRQKGGDGAKTYNDFVRSMNVIDKFNEMHFGKEIPATRPKMEK